ncbi:MAG TPA: hypothetical protein VJS92_18320 [Candidatus Polarisedimenticolaceae bacterium]|nr:hypothetical protein [Candidatus Polarisedimenticolaceae bacterium]
MIRRLVRALVVVGIACVLTFLLWTRAATYPFRGEFCADRHLLESLLTLTVLYGLTVWLLSLLPLPRERRPSDAWMLGLAVAVLAWVPLVLQWPPVSRGHARRAMDQLREMANALETIRTREGQYPAVRDVPTLNERYGLQLPSRDPWGQTYELASGESGYTLISYGNCGVRDTAGATLHPSGPTGEPSADIVLEDGRFVSFPEGMAPRR